MITAKVILKNDQEVEIDRIVDFYTHSQGKQMHVTVTGTEKLENNDVIRHTKTIPLRDIKKLVFEQD